MLKKILFGVVALIVLLVAVILFRTFTYGGAATGERVELPPVPEVSADRAASHLSEAIQFRTITVASGDPRVGQDVPEAEHHEQESCQLQPQPHLVRIKRCKIHGQRQPHPRQRDAE